MLTAKVYYGISSHEVIDALEKDKFKEIPEDKQIKYGIRLKEDARYRKGVLIPYKYFKKGRETTYLAHVKLENDLIELFDILIDKIDIKFGIGYETSDPVYEEIFFD